MGLGFFFFNEYHYHNITPLQADRSSIYEPFPSIGSEFEITNSRINILDPIYNINYSEIRSKLDCERAPLHLEFLNLWICPELIIL